MPTPLVMRQQIVGMFASRAYRFVNHSTEENHHHEEPGEAQGRPHAADTGIDITKKRGPGCCTLIWWPLVVLVGRAPEHQIGASETTGRQCFHRYDARR
ncbi:hypothetical protein MRX96_023662 [Rhipicephalus microplus]